MLVPALEIGKHWWVHSKGGSRNVFVRYLLRYFNFFPQRTGQVETPRSFRL